jgi:hypothetical protein
MKLETRCKYFTVLIIFFINLWQVSGQLDGILSKLEEQQKTTFKILEIVAELRYKDGIEDIEAVFFAVIKSMFLFICIFRKVQ